MGDTRLQEKGGRIASLSVLWFGLACFLSFSLSFFLFHEICMIDGGLDCYCCEMSVAGFMMGS